MSRDSFNLALISSAQKKRLFAGAVILLALALMGLAAKAKTSHYSPESKSSAYFSCSVKISHKAQTLRTLLAVPPIPNPGLPPVVTIVAFAVDFTPLIEKNLEPVAGLRPLRAPPEFSSSLC